MMTLERVMAAIYVVHKLRRDKMNWAMNTNMQFALNRIIEAYDIDQYISGFG